jgi:alkylation response protein AidB-like acyl-CoA dehydrogenase
MFDLRPDDEQIAVVETLREIAQKQIRPAAQSAEAAHAVPEKLASDLLATGLVAPVSEDFGGQGMPDLITYLMAVEELACGDAGIAMTALAQGFATTVISSAGTEQQAHVLLPALADGSMTATVAFLEGYGRRPSEYQTVAERNANGWALSGRKVAVANHDRAELTIVIARRSDNDELGAFVVDNRMVTGSVTTITSDAETGALSLGAARLGTVEYDVQLDDEALLGAIDAAPVDLARAVAQIRLVLATIQIGNARAAVEYAAKYATDREAFGRPISSFQGVAFMITDAEMDVESVRLELWRLATALMEATSGRAAEGSLSRVVARVGEVGLRVTRTGVQVLGGHGFITEHPAERWYRSAGVLAAIDFDPLDSPVAQL